MQINKKDAQKKIDNAIKKGFKNQSEKDEDKTITVSDASKALGIDFEFFLKDIQKNFLKNPATGSTVLNYPATKIKPSKATGFYPKSITIPSILKEFLPKEMQEEIIEKWNVKYADEINKHNIYFK